MFKLIAAATLSSFFFGLFGVNWDSVDRKIEREFPAVKTVSTDALVARLDESGASPPLIFDVRERDEFEISHLNNAVNLESAEDIARLVQQRGLDKDAEIVVYCSVGYRSARVAAELQEQGYSNVLNLEHSLFEWATNGYPMINEDGTTAKVHPFNEAWGALIDDSLHAYPD